MDKLTLENLIFAHAARLESPVWAHRGRLFAPEKKPLLRALIRVYNRFFARENERFLRGDVPNLRAAGAKRRGGAAPFEPMPALCARLPRLYLRREVEEFYKTCRTSRVPAYKTCRTARVSAKNKFDKTKFI